MLTCWDPPLILWAVRIHLGLERTLMVREMTGRNSARDRTRLHRVSKARILAGHPLKPGFHAILVMVVGSILITSAVSFLFSYFHQLSRLLIVWTLLPGALLGFVLLVLERTLGLLKERMLPAMGKMLTAFVLFFVHALGYLALSSIVLNYPLGQLMDRAKEFAGMAGEYSLFSVNFFIVLGVLSWLRNIRSGPNPCF